jgi:hypothetical protein
VHEESAPGKLGLGFAQRSDESVCEVATDRLLETFERGLLGSPIRGGESRDVRENPRRGRWGDLYEHGGTHGTGIGQELRGVDPWRE